MEERLSCLDANPEVASLNLTPDMSKFILKERNRLCGIHARQWRLTSVFRSRMDSSPVSLRR